MTVQPVAYFFLAASLVLGAACSAPAGLPAPKADGTSSSLDTNTAADAASDAAAPAKDATSTGDAGGNGCLQVKPKPLVFGAIGPGAAQWMGAQVCSCGSGELVITDVALAGDVSEFSVNLTDLYTQGVLASPPPVSASNPLKLAPGQCVQFKVGYTVSDSPIPGIPDAATLTFAAQGTGPTSVQLQSTPMSAKCPDNLVWVSEGDTVIPQTLLHLHCDAKLLPGGKVPCNWKIEQPAGSYQPLQPGPNFLNPTLLANAAGEYKICAEVGVPGLPDPCTACTTVQVVPVNSLHIELLWDTPADPDQTDTGPAAGADLDLHFAHPLATGPDLDCDAKGDPWYNNPLDVFWFNSAPDWGQASFKPDNPSLDLDDTDGAGPENLNLEAPEGTLADPVAYSVGVHYWNDHGYGPSFATVAVYVLGSKVAQANKVKLDPLDMWTVGKVWWPNTASGGSKPVFQECLQSGDSCAAKQNLMWQPTGDWCIAKCYINAGFVGAIGGGASASACKGVP